LVVSDYAYYIQWCSDLIYVGYFLKQHTYSKQHGMRTNIAIIGFVFFSDDKRE